LGRFLQQLAAIMTAVLRLLEVQRIPLTVSNAGGGAIFSAARRPKHATRKFSDEFHNLGCRNVRNLAITSRRDIVGKRYG
jgi:hypothetical protein